MFFKLKTLVCAAALGLITIPPALAAPVAHAIVAPVKFYTDNAASMTRYSHDAKSLGSFHRYGFAVLIAPTMLYSKFVAIDAGALRTDVSPRRIVQVLVTAIRQPTTLVSGKTFVRGIQTLLIDAETGDVLSIKLSGTTNESGL